MVAVKVALCGYVRETNLLGQMATQLEDEVHCDALKEGAPACQVPQECPVGNLRNRRLEQASSCCCHHRRRILKETNKHLQCNINSRIKPVTLCCPLPLPYFTS